MSDTHDHTHANPGTNRTRLAIAFGITATILIAEVVVIGNGVRAGRARPLPPYPAPELTNPALSGAAA